MTVSRPPTVGPAGERRCAALIPVKGFRQAKSRLRGALTDEQRSTLARSMAGCVVDAAGGLPTVIMTPDEEVARWGRARGCEVLPDPAVRLSDAVAGAVATLGRWGFARVAVVHADLPLATDVAWLTDGDGVIMVPDRRGNGTNAISVPSAAGFRFSYGPGSRARHEAEAHRIGLPLKSVRDFALGWDVDHPEDLGWPVTPWVAS